MFAVVFAAQTVVGIGNGLENVAVDSVVQREIPPEMLGRVFGALYSAISIAVGIAALLGGPLLDRTSPRLVYLVAGIGIGLVTAVWWRWLPRTA